MNLWCNVTRGNNIESRHEVFSVVIDETGKIIFSTGNPNYVTCIRSSLKPFQASAAIFIGATQSSGFTSDEIALMCSSHNGEKIHVKTAKQMAKKLHIEEKDYQCGKHPPFYTKAQNDRSLSKITPFHNNCSGKHSGMLAIAKKLKTDKTNYLLYNHPVQQTIFSYLEKLTGINKFSYGIDGCSAPTPFLSLLEMAKLFQILGSDKFPELTTAYDAIAKHPYLIGGKNRFDTDFNYILRGRGITKVGGEAIRGMVIKTEKYGVVGIAQKIVDGNQRANETAIMTILNHLNILKMKEKKQLIKYEKKKLFNHRQIHVGNIEGALT